jgi:ERCC4-related helicase
MLDESLRRNIVIALDTGSGKTHIAVLRLKLEAERESRKVSWFLVPTVALAQQQKAVIAKNVPVPVGLISGANEPDQWKDPALWRRVLGSHRIIVSTPDVLLNALRHGYVHLGRDVGFLVFDEAHHAADNHS